ncbi:MAG: response regulator transcription factor [Breoghania sp.]|nr:response regulator transcription factor [Breoghania sp.]
MTGDTDLTMSNIPLKNNFLLLYDCNQNVTFTIYFLLPMSSSSGCILIIDDDPYINILLNIYISCESYDVRIVSNPGEFEKEIHTWRPDVALVNLCLPDADGLDLVGMLRRETDAGIIIISGKSSDLDQIVGLETGADDYVTKPFEPRHLLARIRSVARRRQRKDAAGGLMLRAAACSMPISGNTCFRPRRRCCSST